MVHNVESAAAEGSAVMVNNRGRGEICDWSGEDLEDSVLSAL